MMCDDLSMRRKAHRGLRILVSLLATIATYVLLYWMLCPEDGPAQSLVFTFFASIALVVGGLTTLYFIVDWLLQKRRS